MSCRYMRYRGSSIRLLSDALGLRLGGGLPAEILGMTDVSCHSSVWRGSAAGTYQAGAACLCTGLETVT